MLPSAHTTFHITFGWNPIQWREGTAGETDLVTQGTQIQELLDLKVPAVAIAFRDTAPAGIHADRRPCAGRMRLLEAGGRGTRSSIPRHRITIPVRLGPIPMVWNCPPGRNRAQRSGADHGRDAVPHDGRHSNDPAPTGHVSRGRLCAAHEGHVHSRRGVGPRDRQAADAAGGGGTVRGCGRRWRDDGTADLRRAAGNTAIGKTATSFGCIGNRVYTGLGDDEGYYAIPGER